MTWHEEAVVRWGFNDIPPKRTVELMVEELCRMFSSFFEPLELEMYRTRGEMRIRLDAVGVVPAMALQYGCSNQPMAVYCRGKVRKTSGYLVEEPEIPGNGADASFFAGLDENGYGYVTLELFSDEWFQDDTDPEWLKVFNNCLREAVRILEVGEVVCECLVDECADLVDHSGFSPQMFRKLSESVGE